MIWTSRNRKASTPVLDEDLTTFLATAQDIKWEDRNGRVTVIRVSLTPSRQRKSNRALLLTKPRDLKIANLNTIYP